MNDIPDQPDPRRRNRMRRAAQRRAARTDELRRVDETLDAIGLHGALSWGDDDEVLDPVEQDAALSLLLALRADVDDGIDAATTRVSRAYVGADGRDEGARDEVGSMRRRRLTRRGVAVAGVAAVVVSFGGVAAAAVTSPPGSTLYPLHRVLTGAPADPGRDALQAASRQLREASAAIKHGRLTAADALLTNAARRIDAAGDTDGVAELRTRLQVLRNELAAARLAAASSQPHGSSGSHGPGVEPSRGGQSANHGGQGGQHGGPNVHASSHGQGQDNSRNGSGARGGGSGTGNGGGHGVTDQGGSMTGSQVREQPKPKTTMRQDVRESSSAASSTPSAKPRA